MISERNNTICLWNRGNLLDCAVTINFVRRLCVRYPNLTFKLHCRSESYFRELRLLAGDFAERLDLIEWPRLNRAPSGGVDVWIGRNDYLFDHPSGGDLFKTYLDFYRTVVAPELGLDSPMQTEEDVYLKLPAPSTFAYAFDWLIMNNAPYDHQSQYSPEKFIPVLDSLSNAGYRVAALQPVEGRPHIPAISPWKMSLNAIAQIASTCRYIVAPLSAAAYAAINSVSRRTLQGFYLLDERPSLQLDDRFHHSGSIDGLVALIRSHGHGNGRLGSRQALSPEPALPDNKRGASSAIGKSRECTGRTAPRVFWCHFNDPHNLGDQMCCPLDYFDFPGRRLNLTESPRWLDPDVIVIGGGGLFNPGSLADMVARMVAHGKKANPDVKLISWGLGANQHCRQDFAYPEYLEDFSIAGIRDYGSPYEFVPCCSCMHQAFDRKPPEPEHEIVVYHHHDLPMNEFSEYPSRSNDARASQFEEVLMFLASGNTVITNTYHGAYWSMLLGRKVVVYKPFSNRFLGFARPPAFADKETWREQVKTAVAYANYLDECRSVNVKFAARVRDFLDGLYAKTYF